MSHHAISYHVIPHTNLHCITSHHVRPKHYTTFLHATGLHHVLLHRNTSHHVASPLTQLHNVTSHHATSCNVTRLCYPLVTLCHITSRRFTPQSYVTSHHRVTLRQIRGKSIYKGWLTFSTSPRKRADGTAQSNEKLTCDSASGAGPMGQEESDRFSVTEEKIRSVTPVRHFF